MTVPYESRNILGHGLRLESYYEDGIGALNPILGRGLDSLGFAIRTCLLSDSKQVGHFVPKQKVSGIWRCHWVPVQILFRGIDRWYSFITYRYPNTYYSILTNQIVLNDTSCRSQEMSKVSCIRFPESWIKSVNQRHDLSIFLIKKTTLGRQFVQGTHPRNATFPPGNSQLY